MTNYRNNCKEEIFRMEEYRNPKSIMDLNLKDKITEGRTRNNNSNM